ncbi:MAG: tRNA threonylcarbamoyladenosine biosynthesis protein TsaE [Anaerophaga sp.]|nr:tRNA threonylcarbamoyladenosine biosynthesis protein TsaE [Anaerophaga sp.]
MHIFTIQLEQEIEKVAKEFLPLLREHKVVAFYGEMGVGKTTFIKGLCRVMGVTGTVTSPSFALVNEYTTDNGTVIYHFDFYRLKNVIEVFDMGYEDYFFSDHICLIEWPEKVADVLPDNRLDVTIIENPDGSRTIRATE